MSEEMMGQSTTEGVVGGEALPDTWRPTGDEEAQHRELIERVRALLGQQRRIVITWREGCVASMTLDDEPITSSMWGRLAAVGVPMGVAPDTDPDCPIPFRVNHVRGSTAPWCELDEPARTRLTAVVSSWVSLSESQQAAVLSIVKTCAATRRAPAAAR